MKKTLIFILLLSTANLLFPQEPQFYIGDDNQRHLCGAFDIKVLETDSSYQEWYNRGYGDFTANVQKAKWAKELSDIEVEIYLGTWCGDSKNWVPKFVKMWDELKLSRENLHFTALYDFIEGENKYKQGPNGEEKGKGIHRVPTFIFYKNGEEVARIVESPVNELETDLAQIALGFPSKPNYRGASYMLELFKSKKMSEIESNKAKHFYAVYPLIKRNPSELNTLGYVLLESGKVEEALLVFYFNTRYFRNNPNVYDSYAEALAENGQIEEAIENYEKVLLLDRSNSNAIGQINALKEQ